MECGDIIRHSPVVFFSFKDHPSVVSDERLRAKITAIRDAGGFQSTYCPDPGLISRHTPSKSQINKRPPHTRNPSVRFRGNVIQSKEQHTSTPEKVLKGLMNKLTHANFERVYPKIIACIPLLSVVFVVKSLLETSANQQSTFSNVFVMAVKHLSNNHPQVVEYIEKYVNDFCMSEWCLTSENTKKENYDEFCHRLKLKSTTLGTVKTMIALAETSLCQIEPKLFLGNTLPSNLHDVEIFIDTINLLVQSKSVPSTQIIAQIRPSLEKWEREFRNDGGMRIVFKARDLLKN